MNQVLDNELKNGQLSAHAGAVPCTREELAGLITPERTATWTPVPHAELIDRLEETLERRLINVTAAKFAIGGDNGERLFAVMDLVSSPYTNWTKGVLAKNDTYQASLGLRASNDKRFSIQIMIGAHVFVCDNMAFSGGIIALNRKHTSGLLLESELTMGVERYIAGYAGLQQSLDVLQTTPIADRDADLKIYDCFAKHILPVRYFHDVRTNYFEPPHQEFKPRTMWSLHNAFTEAMKPMPVITADRARVLLGREFGI